MDGVKTIAAGVLLAWATLVAAPTAADEYPVYGDPFSGRELLSEKLCTQCHSVWGHGGQIGPDITTAVEQKSWLELVGNFWNHTPRMIDAVRRQGHAWPTVTRDEMADLLSFLYYLRLFDDPGDPGRGQLAYARLQCEVCHSLGGRGGSGGGGPLDDLSAFRSTVPLAQAMWNAGPAMQRVQLARGTIPLFSGAEMADIQAFIRSRGLRDDRRVHLLPLPDPSTGAEVFEAKRCGACHRSDGGGEGPDLDAASLHLTVAEIAGVLWNHSYAMHDRMRARGIPFPQFDGTQMADLMAYLHFLGFFRDQGNSATGQALFRDRGCVTCHSGRDSAAPDLSSVESAVDPVAMAAAMWNHAPQMHELMADRSVAWPTFDPGEMEHLVAFLRELARTGEGKGQ